MTEQKKTRTEQKKTMTMEQVEEEMEEYRRIFDVVRLIEEETIQMMEELYICKSTQGKEPGDQTGVRGRRYLSGNCLLYGNRWKSICNGTGEKTERRIPSGRRGM